MNPKRGLKKKKKWDVYERRDATRKRKVIKIREKAR